LERALQELDSSRRELLDLLPAVQKSVYDGEEQFSVELKQRSDKYARLYEQARELRHSLIIRREAVGLRGPKDVDRQYPLPRLLTLATATRPEGDQ
jgi:NADH:ubiquinone oxidoreductase subunit D